MLNRTRRDVKSTYKSESIAFILQLTLTLKRLSMTLRQTANGKNETFAVRL